MDGFDDQVLRRLPLAQSVLSIFAYVLNEPFLDALFAEHRRRCYEATLTFATLVYLVRDALLIHQGRGLPSFQRAAAAGELPVREGSVYPKLARIPPALSAALLRESGVKMVELFDHPHPPAPAGLDGLQLIAFDGKTIKRVRRQLKPLRPLQGRLLGGKLLIAQDVRSGLALAMDASPDALRNETPLVPCVVEQVRSLFPSPKLWIGDRQFCDLNLMKLLTENGQGEENGEHFLIRMNRSMGFSPDPARPAMEGTDLAGRSYTQQWGWVGGVRDKRRRYVRKITLIRSQTQQEDVVLLSDLLDERAHPAQGLLDAYLMRWGIERMFQTITEVFCLRRLIGCTPRANIFQASFCLVIYNAIQVVRSCVARCGNVQTEEVSTARLFDDVQEELIAQSRLGSAHAVSRRMRQVTTAARMKQLLSDLLADQGVERWRKTPGNPRKTRGRTQRAPSGRTSVFRVLESHRATRPARRIGRLQRR